MDPREENKNTRYKPKDLEENNELNAKSPRKSNLSKSMISKSPSMRKKIEINNKRKIELVKSFHVSTIAGSDKKAMNPCKDRNDLIIC